MKTSEFIKKVERLGYDTESHELYVRVYAGHILVASVSEYSVNMVTTNFIELVPNELFDLCVEYAKTPIEERKDVKKYFLYNPIKEKYFNYYIEEEEYHWSDPHPPLGVQTQFTEEEIKNHKFRDIMELLVKEEVK